MGLPSLKLVKLLAFAGMLLCHSTASALEFLPGIGVGLEYTDNATLVAENPVDDVIAVGYVGAQLSQAEGPVTADIITSLNHVRYTNDTFEDTRYFNLGARTGWEMITDRFDWFLNNFFWQRPINTTDPNTPDNIQDTNFFNFGADMSLPISGRQTVALRPEYLNFYYEIQLTDNQQYALTADWKYLLTPLTNVGLKGNVRRVDYDEPAIDDVSFGSVFFAVATDGARYYLRANIGTTYVERDNGQSTEEPAGNLDWLLELTGRSSLRAFISSDLSDSSRVAFGSTLDPGTGDPNDIQITTDVIRSRVATLGYTREDATLVSSLTGTVRELNYSESPNDRRIRLLNAALNFPVTASLSSGLYARYNQTEFLDAVRTDDNYTVGGGFRYLFTERLKTSFDLKYRNRDSTRETLNFKEWSVYLSLAYGFGQPLRPTRVGGF